MTHPLEYPPEIPPHIPWWAANRFPPGFASPYTKEDIVQEVYTEIYSRLHTYNPSLTPDFHSWCLSQARRAAIRLHRQEHGRSPSTYRAFIPTTFGDTTTPADNKHHHEHYEYHLTPHYTPQYFHTPNQDILNILSQLPPRLQQLNLWKAQGLTLKTIGQKLGVTEARASQLWTTSREKSRKLRK